MAAPCNGTPGEVCSILHHLLLTRLKSKIYVDCLRQSVRLLSVCLSRGHIKGRRRHYTAGCGHRRSTRHPLSNRYWLALNVSTANHLFGKARLQASFLSQWQHYCWKCLGYFSLRHSWCTVNFSPVFD